MATSTFLDENENAIVVKYGTFESLLVLSSPIIHLVIIGHGVEDGVIVDYSLWSWNRYTTFIDSINAFQVVLLNCQSSNLDGIKELKDKNIQTFHGNIDARLGAMIASLTVNRFDRDFNFQKSFLKIVNLYRKLSNGVLNSVSLGLEGFEAVWYISMVVVYLLAVLVSETMLSSSAVTYGAREWAGIYGIAKIQLILGLIGWALGDLSFWTWAESIFWFLGDDGAIGELVAMILARATTWEYIVWGGWFSSFFGGSIHLRFTKCRIESLSILNHVYRFRY